MPPIGQNIRLWIEQSDIDYYTHFIKAWIPFNAWYNSRYPDKDSDRAKINAIKREPGDPVRKAINTLLERDGRDAQDFKSYLAALHDALEQNQLQSSESDCMIRFTQIVREKNPINVVDNHLYKGISYYLKREDGKRLNEVAKFIAYVKKSNGDTTFRYEHTSYDEKHLLAEFENGKNGWISETQKKRLRLLFLDLKPVVQTSAIHTTTALEDYPKNYYTCDNYHFKRDTADTGCPGHIVAKALIESLYQLRNILFHGELTPSESVQPVYQNAYLILKMLLEKVK